jgi:GNAT superfamily N-acetyltransferase
MRCRGRAPALLTSLKIPTMTLTLRPATPADAPACALICFDAFCAISGAHGFPPDFPNLDAAAGVITACLSHPAVYGVVAEHDGRVVGSNFLWENAAVAGVGPITVDPRAQNAAAGRRLMEHVIARAGFGDAAKDPGRPRRFAGVRLVQAAFHNRSLSLYAKLGFDVREPLACINGEPPRVHIPGRTVRPAAAPDLEPCCALATRIHGFDRRDDLAGAIARASATLVEHDGRITGYATLLGFFGHAVAETNDDLKALIGAAQHIAGPGFLLPTTNTDLFRWCLARGLRVVQPMTLMSMGLYQHPRGAWLPSILY